MRYKLGDRVTIVVSRRGDKRKALPAPPETHYGPLRRIEDESKRPTRGRLSVAVLDLSTVFIQRLVNLSLGRKVLFYTQHYGNVAGLQGTFIQSPLLLTREELETGVGTDTIGGANLSPNATAVIDATHGEYRATFIRWPLPFLHTADYGLTLSVGDRVFLLSDATEEWVEREVTNEVELDEQATPWSASSPSDTSTPNNLWHDFFQEWWKNYARIEFKPAAVRSAWSVESQDDLPCFEAFDPFDDENFKVMVGDEERPAPRFDIRGKGKKLVQIGLVPRFWTYEIEFVEWALDTSGPTTLYKRTGTVTGEMLGITCPYVNEYDIDHEPLNQVDYQVGSFSGTGGIFILSGSDHPTSATFTASFDGLPPQATPFAPGGPSYSDEHTNFLMHMMSAVFLGGNPETTFSGDYPVVPHVIERSDCTLTLTLSATPVGALVGKVRHRGNQYDIRRRTENPGGQVVYSGGFDSLGIASPWGLSNYHNSFFNSFSRDFSDYDPLNLAAHVTI